MITKNLYFQNCNLIPLSFGSKIAACHSALALDLLGEYVYNNEGNCTWQIELQEISSVPTALCNTAHTQIASNKWIDGTNKRIDGKWKAETE